MGNTSIPGSVVIREIDHDVFQLLGADYYVRELHWNGSSGRSYDIVRAVDDVVITGESFDNYPTADELRDTIEQAEAAATVACKFCEQQVSGRDAHLHMGSWVGECCWDERLRATE